MEQTNLQPQRLSGVVKKGWGYELIWATNEKYAGKILAFDHAGSKMSMHFHRQKDETWFVWHNPPLQPHQLIALVDGASITEVSTPDSVEDNYRISPGDSQKEQTKDVKPVPPQY